MALSSKSKREKQWEEWKRRKIAAAPSDQRKWMRELLDDAPLPTLEDERVVRRIREDVERVFGKEPKKRKRPNQASA